MTFLRSGSTFINEIYSYMFNMVKKNESTCWYIISKAISQTNKTKQSNKCNLIWIWP